MATKWSAMIKKMRDCLEEKTDKRERVMALGVLVMLGASLLFHLLGASYTTGAVWAAGVFANVLLTPAVFALAEWKLKKLGESCPEPTGEEDDPWMEQWYRMRRTVGLVLAGALLVAFCAFFLRNPSGAGQLRNYAPNYLLFATVFFQFGVCCRLMDQYRMERMEAYREVCEKNSRAKMEEAMNQALAIERESQEKVSRSDKLRMDLITNVSHDLKTPLTSMVGYLELLKKEELDGKAREYVEVIACRADKLKEMIESLFSLAKVSSGNVELKREEISVNRLIGQIFADMNDQIERSGLEYVRRLCQEDTNIVTDNRYIYRIFQNLMENTLKYSAAGTRVFVQTSVTPEGQVTIEITNTANYRMEFQKEDIIERFARADASRSTEGNGLGLAIVSTYAAALGGSFDIRIDCDQFKAILQFA